VWKKKLPPVAAFNVSIIAADNIISAGALPDYYDRFICIVSIFKKKREVI
jgi:hypothetical protein